MIACSPSLYDYRILGYAGLANPRPDGQIMFGPAPTWVPDFSHTFLATPFTILNKNFKATLPRDFEQVVLESFSANPTLISRNSKTLGLLIKTTLIDTIEEMPLPGICTDGSPLSNYREVLKRQIDVAREGLEMLKQRNLYPDSGGASAICLETMSTGSFHDGNRIPKFQTGVFDAFLESRGAPKFLPRSKESSAISYIFAQIHKSAIGLSKRLFVTKGGYLGVANNGIENGDRVCLINGAPVPFILRGPVASFGKYNIYNLVCDTYIHGFMYGERSNDYGREFETILSE